MKDKQLAEIAFDEWVESIGGADSDAYHDYPVDEVFIEGFLRGRESHERTIKKLTVSNRCIVENNRDLASKYAELMSDRFCRFNNEECWIYDETGDNYLESLVCPVVIRADVLQRMLSERDLLIAERDGYKVRGDGHWETLKSVREIAKEGDLERVIQWVNDAGGGYTEPNEKTLARLMDENQKLLAEREQMMKQEPYPLETHLIHCGYLTHDQVIDISESIPALYAKPVPQDQSAN